jgi:hypothetical protein
LYRRIAACLRDRIIEYFIRCHSQAIALHGIERRERLASAVDLWFIAVLWLIAQRPA